MASRTSAHISEGSSQLQPAPIASPYPTTDREPAEDMVESPLNSTISEPSDKSSISEFVWLQGNDTPLSEAPFRFMALPKSEHQLHCLLKGVLAVLHTSRSLREESITAYRRSASAPLESRRLPYEQLEGVLKTLPVGPNNLLMRELWVDRGAMVNEIRHVCLLLQAVRVGQTNERLASMSRV